MQPYDHTTKHHATILRVPMQYGKEVVRVVQASSQALIDELDAAAVLLLDVARTFVAARDVLLEIHSAVDQLLVGVGMWVT